MRCVLAAVLFVTTATTVLADTLWVPDDYATMQAAIHAATDGNEVVVRPGTYMESINFVGKRITVRSLMGPTTTIIDGGQAGSVVRVRCQDNSTTIPRNQRGPCAVHPPKGGLPWPATPDWTRSNGDPPA